MKMDDTTSNAIVARNLSKSFSKGYGTTLQICEKFNLTLPRGSIYALYGPSSCGKTSLIRAILGRIVLDKGDIWVLGHKVNGRLSDAIPLSEIGYMPQESSLYEMLTIGETLALFGCIYGLSEKEVKCKTDFYIDFLRLPNKHTINRNLSGGERQRVSFAASIIHQPSLLLLDEPTIGLDPMIRQSIWQLLTSMASTKSVSILLTTNCIDESRNADIVGMWLGDNLQVEAAPNQLLSSLSCNTLEEALLHICTDVILKTDILANATATHETAIDGKALNLTALVPRSDAISASADGEKNSHAESRVTSYQRVIAFTQKNFLQLYRFPAALIFYLVLPPFIMLAFCSAFGKFGGIQVAVHTSDNGPFGNLYLKMLDPDVFNQTAVPSFEIGRQAVSSGSHLAFININENFSSYLIDALTNEYRFTQVNDVARLNDYYAGIYLNGIDFPVNLLIKLNCVLNILKLCFSVANYSNAPLVMCKPPVKVHLYIDGVALTNVPVRVFFIPGFLIISCFFAALSVAVLCFPMEKRNSCLERCYIAGLSTLEIMCSHIVVTVFVIISQVVGVMLIAYWLYEAPLHGSLVLAFLMLFWTAVCGMSAGFTLSTLVDDMYAISIWSFCGLILSIPLSGWLWQVSAMPKFLLYISYSMPFALQIESLIGIMNHSWEFWNRNVLTAFAVTTAWLPILNGISYYRLRVKR